MEEVYFKPYASCRMNHGPIQLALELKAKHGLNVEDIEEILVKTYDFPVQRTGSIKTDTNSPFTVCQFSMSYAVAGALLDGEAGLETTNSEENQGFEDPPAWFKAEGGSGS